MSTASPELAPLYWIDTIDPVRRPDAIAAGQIMARRILAAGFSGASSCCALDPAARWDMILGLREGMEREGVQLDPPLHVADLGRQESGWWPSSSSPQSYTPSVPEIPAQAARCASLVQRLRTADSPPLVIVSADYKLAAEALRIVSLSSMSPAVWPSEVFELNGTDRMQSILRPKRRSDEEAHSPVILMGRHPRDVCGAAGLRNGHADYGLTLGGQHQLKRLTDWLSAYVADERNDIHITHVYSSPMLRAFTMTKALNQHIGARVIVHPSLVEKNAGLGTLRPKEEAAALEQRRSTFGVPFGESDISMYKRAAVTLDEIEAAQREIEGDCFIVTHSRFMTMALAYCLGIKRTELATLELISKPSPSTA